MRKRSTAPRPRVGDQTWFVEWCVKLGLVDEADPAQGHDPDANVTRVRRAATREEALAIAREVHPADQNGAVVFWSAEFVAYDEADAVAYPHAGHWEGTADVEFYEGPEETQGSS